MPTWILVVNAVSLLVLAAVVFRLIRVEHRMAELTPIKALWATVQTKIAKDLVQPHELLARLEALTITEVERLQLKVLLKEIVASRDPTVSSGDKTNAKLMIGGVMEKVLEEAASDAAIVDIGPVGAKETKEE